MVARFAQEFGFLDERAYRDFCIREKFKVLRGEGMKMEKIEMRLSEEFSNDDRKLTPESIHRIVYNKKV